MLMKPYLNHLDQVVDYNNVNVLHYSTLKLLAQSVRAFKERVDEEEDDERLENRLKKHFLIGGAVDMLLTDNAKFDETYIQFDGKAAGEKADIVLQGLAVDEINLRLIDSTELRDYCWSLGFYTNWKDGESHRKELMKNIEYYEFLCAANGKIILDAVTYSAIQATYKRIIEGRYTGTYISELQTNPKLRVYPQYCLIAEIYGILYKGMLDFCVFDDENHHITIIDVKTLWKHSNMFPKQLEWLRYDLQAVGYIELVRKLFPTYTVSYRFIVESTDAKLTSPVIYELSEQTLYEGKYGNIERFKVGFEELISRYMFHDFSNEWTYDRIVVDNNGVLTI